MENFFALMCASSRNTLQNTTFKTIPWLESSGLPNNCKIFSIGRNPLDSTWPIRIHCCRPSNVWFLCGLILHVCCTKLSKKTLIGPFPIEAQTANSEIVWDLIHLWVTFLWSEAVRFCLPSRILPWTSLKCQTYRHCPNEFLRIRKHPMQNMLHAKYGLARLCRTHSSKKSERATIPINRFWISTCNVIMTRVIFNGFIRSSNESMRSWKKPADPI